jgi:hypothetical protein
MDQINKINIEYAEANTVLPLFCKLLMYVLRALVLDLVNLFMMMN